MQSDSNAKMHRLSTRPGGKHCLRRFERLQTIDTGTQRRFEPFDHRAQMAQLLVVGIGGVHGSAFEAERLGPAARITIAPVLQARQGERAFGAAEVMAVHILARVVRLLAGGQVVVPGGGHGVAD